MVPSILTTKYTEKAIQQHVIERKEAMYYTVSTNGVNVYRVQRNNNFRDVILSQTAELGAFCPWMLPEALRIKCRHIFATEEHVPQLKNCNSISHIYLSQHFKTLPPSCRVPRSFTRGWLRRSSSAADV